MKYATRYLPYAVLFFIMAVTFTGCSNTEETAPTVPDDWSLSAKTQPTTRWYWLFDGKSLKSWAPHGGDAEWQVKDLTLIAEATDIPSYIATTAAYDNFVLTVDFWADHGQNSGIFIRGPAVTEIDKPISPDTGYEINIADQDPSGYHTGSIVGIAQSSGAVATAGKWNNLEITADGDHLMVKLNGKITADIHDSTHTNGIIAFQASGQGQVKFRQIKFRDLR